MATSAGVSRGRPPHSAICPAAGVTTRRSVGARPLYGLFSVPTMTSRALPRAAPRLRGRRRLFRWDTPPEERRLRPPGRASPGNRHAGDHGACTETGCYDFVRTLWRVHLFHWTQTSPG